MNYLQIILTFMGGLGLFLYGMNIMGEGLQKAAGNRLKKLLGVLTNNRFLGVLVGAAVAAIIQSSSAATVMVVGFVNAELMTLSQAIGVIMGANVGTTITAWIVALGEWSKFLQPSTLAPITIIIGVIMLFFSPKDKTRQYGGILFGFGALFLGLDMMGGAVQPLSTLPQFKTAFTQIGGNPILGILTGAVVTAIIQSSSASVGILQTLAAASLVPWNAAVYIIMGQNIGTCITAMLSAIGATKNGKRAAAIHLLFNVIGSIVFAIVAAVYFMGINVAAGNALITMTQISIVHTVFNLLNTIMLFPFADKIIVLAEKIVSGKEPELEGELEELVHLDNRILETPTFAIQNVIKEIVRMGELSSLNLKMAAEGLLEKDKEKLEEVYLREKTINELQHGINNYLVKITNTPISEQEHAMITGLFHSVSDIERVGDHADNIAELAEIGIDDGLEFSEVANGEIQEIVAAAGKSFQLAIEACAANDAEIAREVLEAEKLVNEMEKTLRAKHIKRLTEEKCSSIAGITFLDLLSNLERVSDHAANIAHTIIELES
ncbi:MAG: Na/Pi cotransporter family protein [Epulopiscium sp.]|nr:Na/Pi cotransporter family protein [Candidatus Epulonipiscium sp.]